MEKEAAVKLLQKKLSELDKDNFDPEVWTGLTSEIIKKLFSKSFEGKIKFLNEISYSITAMGATQEMQTKRKLKGITQAKNYLAGYIDELDALGIEE